MKILHLLQLLSILLANCDEDRLDITVSDLNAFIGRSHRKDMMCRFDFSDVIDVANRCKHYAHVSVQRVSFDNSRELGNYFSMYEKLYTPVDAKLVEQIWNG